MWRNGVVSIDQTTLAKGPRTVKFTYGKLILKRKRLKEDAAPEKEEKVQKKNKAAEKREAKTLDKERKKRELERERKRVEAAKKRAVREKERKRRQKERNRKFRKTTKISMTAAKVSVSSNLLALEQIMEENDGNKSSAGQEIKMSSLAQRLGLPERKYVPSDDNSKFQETAFTLMKLHSVDADWLLLDKVEREESVGDQMCMEEPGWRGWKLLDKENGVQLCHGREENAGAMSEEEI
ncbi:heterogeneous nuclear ribonucleoprotein U-like protein 2 isoform X1 [Gracilaria domingensis]|nr:heterogeneous nuclear ribonucleoprotein U-like protein 2 isoform X1 [Gracilaria domingensis]